MQQRAADTACLFNWAFLHPACCCTPCQSASNLVKGQVKHLSDMRVQSIKHHDTGLEMPDLPPGEAWGVQLFRTIDSSKCCQCTLDIIRVAVFNRVR